MQAPVKRLQEGQTDSKAQQLSLRPERGGRERAVVKNKKKEIQVMTRCKEVRKAKPSKLGGGC